VSAPGQGSTFTVRLPAAPVIRSIPLTAHPGEEPYVLLVEDDPHSADLMRTQLNSAGYRVDVAADGTSGLSAARAHTPDVIILDVALPDIDGWEVIRQIKADQRLADVPVFFASILDDAQAGLALGAQDYFVKPVDSSRLLAALASAVAARATPRVLVVDHDDDIRHVIEDGLRAGGADVVAVAEGRDGLAETRAGHFDLIICDMHAPDADGFDLLDAIAKEPDARNTPVLGVSAATGNLAATTGKDPQ
jgi:CheY-like chemotaxis protein